MEVSGHMVMLAGVCLLSTVVKSCEDNLDLF